MDIGGKRGQQGFLLMEAVVSLAIFLFVVMAVISMFIAMIQHQRRLLVERDLVNQLTYVQDRISRSLMQAKKATDTTCLGATGRIYELIRCPVDTSLPCGGIKFINKLDQNACTEFFLDSSDPANPVFKEQKTGGTAQNLLSSKLSVVYARFILEGDKSVRSSVFGGASQPRVTFLMDVRAEGQEKILQTTVSQRDLNKSF